MFSVSEACCFDR